MAIYFGATGLTFAGLLIAILPYIPAPNVVLAIISLFVLVKFLFIATKLKDPGYLKKATNVPFLRLVEKLNPNELCPKCELTCTEESRHCFICERCVEGFDHHCQWLDSCIGANNHNTFLLFVFAMQTYIVSVILLFFNYVDLDFTESLLQKQQAEGILPNVLGSKFGLSIEAQEQTFILTFVSIVLLSVLFFVSVSYLILAQVQGIMEARAKKSIRPISSPSMTKRLVDKVPASIDSQNLENCSQFYLSSEANSRRNSATRI